MSVPLSPELGAVFEKAEEIAANAGGEPTTGHLLAALMEVPNRADGLLADRPLDARGVRDQLREFGRESGHLVDSVRRRARRLAEGTRSERVSPLHLLAALTRESSGHAYTLMEAAGVDIGALRTAVMSYATTSRPVSSQVEAGSCDRPEGSKSPRDSSGRAGRDRRSRSSIGFHPSLQVGRRSESPKAHPRDSEKTDSDQPCRDDSEKPAGSSRRRDPNRQTGSHKVRLDLESHPGINRGGRPKECVFDADRRGRRLDSASEGGESAQESGDQPARPTGEDGEGADDEQAERCAEAIDDARKTTRDLAARLFSGDESSDAPPPRQHDSGRREDTQTHGGDGETIDDPRLAADYELDADVFPNLTDYGRNLGVQAACAEIDPVVGRGEEIARLIDILGKRRANNPLLVGEPGVGKTAIVEGLARRLVEMNRCGMPIGQRTIVELEMSRLLSGTHLRGAFSERLLGIKDEVAAADGDVIVFLDEIHMWMDAGSSGDGSDAAGELKTALARGRFPCIGATTHDEFRRFVESDPAFERRFERVDVQEPDEETALEIVEGVQANYQRHHGVEYTERALSAAVRMSVRYIHDRQLPDKAIGVLDLAGSRAARRGETTVDRDMIASVVADAASIPPARLTGSEGDRFLNMESFLSDGIVGHDDVIETVCRLLRRNYAGFRGDRPIGSLLFLGPTGVGKTEMVKVLADFLFHDRDAVVQIDMSEFMESHSVSRLIGSPPGYVGHEQGGQLTETIRRRPYQVVLLDEIEKAHQEVLNLLLQLFDEGRLTDGRGRQVDFSNALIVMTSNLGAEVFDQPETPSSSAIGFSRRDGSRQTGRRDAKRLRHEALTAAGDHFSPELWNRIDEKLVFLPLSRDEIAEIAELQLADSQRKLFEESDIQMDYTPGVIEHLIENGGYDPEYGARPMRQTIERLVEAEVAREILADRVEEGGRVVVAVEAGEIAVKVG